MMATWNTAVLSLSACIALTAVLYSLMSHGKSDKVAIVMPCHDHDIDVLLGREWAQCGRFARKHASVFILHASQKPDFLGKKLLLQTTLAQSRCFKTVRSLHVNLRPDLDHHPLAPSLLFFHAFSQPSIVFDHEWMFWMEPDMHACHRDWQKKLVVGYVNILSKLDSVWMAGSVMRAHTDPLAPFYSFAEHINGNALYSLRHPAFVDFLERVQQAFIDDPARFKESFDIAIYQVARHYDGFWEWARRKHHFLYTEFVQNHYGMAVNASQLCEEHVGTLFIHGKVLKS